MTKAENRCTNCGYELGSSSPGLGFPCLISDAKVKMGGTVRSTFDEPVSARELTSQTQSIHDVATTPNKSPQAILKRTVKAKTRVSIVYRAPKKWQPPQKNEKPTITARKPPGLNCVLCGEAIQFGALLEHKIKVHGEKPVAAPKRKSKFKRIWVSVYQGGLPGLGKRR